MDNNDIEIEYVSPLAKAQRQGDIQSALRMIELFSPLSQIDPAAMDYIDIDGMSKYLLRMLSVPATTIRGDEQVAAIREQRQQQQAEAMQNQQTMQFMEAAGQAAPALRAADAAG
jgi:hypothetical protein